RHEKIALCLTSAGIPVLDGTSEALKAVKHMLSWRDFLARTDRVAESPVSAVIRQRWLERLAGGALDENDGLDLLQDYGIATPHRKRCSTCIDAIEAADGIGYPVALKTAMRNVSHKSDVGGVHLNLVDRAAVSAAYDDLAKRLGPEVLVQQM